MRSRFCSADHRKRHRAGSARALRDMEDLCGDDEWSSNAVWRSTRLLSDEKKQTTRDQATIILGLLAAGFIVVALLGGSGKRGSGIPASSYLVNTQHPGMISRWMAGLFQNHASLDLHTDFNARPTDWISAHNARPWSFTDGYARPAGLRLWKESTALSDYDFEFVGQIQRHSMSWAFRAPDMRNYYASKLTIEGAGAQPNAGLVRFVVLDGRECERVELPIPLTLSRGTDYQIHLTVRGTRFLTSINGQLVSSWTDSRLRMGGVGFFSEDGELAAVKWASLRERDSVLGRIASYFSLITFPAAPGFRPANL